MIWGMTSGGWMSGLTSKASDPHAAQLELLSSHGLHATSWRARELMSMEPSRREELAQLAERLDVRIGLLVGFDYFTDDADELERGTARILEALEVLPSMFRSPVCVSGIRRHNSFTREPSVSEQIERLSVVLAPIAEAAHAAGCPLGLHNSGHYCSDLAELCRRTPYLGILFDTGNPFLAGERPARAALAAAPFTVGTHFKDHYVRPNKESSPLCLELKGAVVGEGDAGIKEIYEVLRAETPDAESLVMLLEIDPVEGLQREEALARSLEFVASL